MFRFLEIFFSFRLDAKLFTAHNVVVDGANAMEESVSLNGATPKFDMSLPRGQFNRHVI